MPFRSVWLGLAVAASLSPLSAGAADRAEFPGSVYVAVQGANEVEVLPQGTVWHDISAAHYDDVSRDGRLVLVTSAQPGQVYVIDAASGKKLAVLPTGKMTQGVKIAPDGRYALVVDPGAGTVAVVDLRALKVIKNIAVGKTPHNVVYSHDGRTAYVTLQGQGAIALIDMRKLKKVGEIHTPGLSTPHNLDLSPDGHLLWVRDFVGHVGVVDLRTRKVLHIITVGNGHAGIDVIPGGRYVFTGGIADEYVDVINPHTYKVVKRINVGPGPHGVRASRDGRWVYAEIFGENSVAVIDTHTLRVVNRIKTGKGPFWAAVQGNN